MNRLIITPGHVYRPWLKTLFYFYISTLFVLTLTRFGFITFFGVWSELINHPIELMKALFLGLRYDWIPVSYMFALPFLILHFIQFFKSELIVRFTSKFFHLYFFGFYSFLVWAYVFDYGFYSYFQDHLNILFFGFLEDDTKALLTSIAKNYNLPFWLSVIFIGHFAFYKLLGQFFRKASFKLKSSMHRHKLAFFSLGLFVLAFGARGNFSRLPLSVEDAYISSNDFINKLSLNGLITFNRAIKIRKHFSKAEVSYIKEMGMGTWQNALIASERKIINENEFLPNLKQQTSKKVFTPPHVVLVVMESFGSYWFDQQAENFNFLGSLDQHFKEDILFTRFLSGENGTIGSILSVATGQVIRPGARFLSEGEYMRTTLQSSASITFERAGYDTHFVYGGKLGWRDLGKYLKAQNFYGLHGADEIKKQMPELSQIAPRDLGNEWGIFDEYLYTFIEKKLKNATRPQFFVVLTTTNHPPFEFPRTYKPHPLELTPQRMSELTVDKEIASQRFLALQYSNQTFADFMSRIKSSQLKDNTVVSLTGDHSFWLAKSIPEKKYFNKNAVPFYIYAPEHIRPKTYDAQNFGSHEDILPTLYELTLSEISYIKLGEDLINEDGVAINSAGIAGSKRGVMIEGRPYCWMDLNYTELKACTEDLSILWNYRSGMIAITDEFLRATKSLGEERGLQ
ncbi:MAG: LTA synthase family protein [Bacteriovoracaceae bacterium]